MILIQRVCSPGRPYPSDPDDSLDQVRYYITSETMMMPAFDFSELFVPFCCCSFCYICIYLCRCRPAPLEEFLVPNEINWTMPAYFAPVMNDTHRPKKLTRFLKNTNLIRQAKDSVVIETKMQSHDGGSELYLCDRNHVESHVGPYHHNVRTL